MRSAQAPYTVTTGDAVSAWVVLSELATENIMGSTHYFIAVAAIMAALQVPALAEDTPAPPPVQASPPQSQAPPSQPQDSDDHRFAFHRIDGGFLRLDMRTGAVASCRASEADWTCVPARDERAALDREIMQLQRDNATLKNALLERGVPLPGGMAPTPPSGAGDETVPRPPQTVPPTALAPGTRAPGTPSGASPEAEIDRVMDAVEKGWRRLVEMMTNLQRDLQKKQDSQKKEKE